MNRPLNERKLWDQLFTGLENHVLIECYHNAVEMMLDKDFIELLRNEIVIRGIEAHLEVEKGLLMHHS